MNGVSIIRVEKITEVIVEAVNRLLSQLVTSKSINISENELNEIVLSESSDIFLMYFDDNIIGMFTLASYITPSGRKYWLEDVVIDKDFRGKSLGRKLVNEAIIMLSDKGKSTLLLTSKPLRIAANRLYLSLGFNLKETNVYKMDFD